MNTGWIVIGIAIIAVVGVIGISYLNYEMNTMTSDEVNEELNDSDTTNVTRQEFVEKMQDFQEDNERYANENQIPDYIGDV